MVGMADLVLIRWMRSDPHGFIINVQTKNKVVVPHSYEKTSAARATISSIITTDNQHPPQIHVEEPQSQTTVLRQLKTIHQPHRTRKVRRPSESSHLPIHTPQEARASRSTESPCTPPHLSNPHSSIA
ncbi:unnamed protein product [Periconia digitata]|uniref:Uncharacterized protein n=1 Tax=Periconia digitata TaxID=1303443 RepID=A0A9W4XNA4_9PLEO|nr:unnamed protein product [Periconia digitata]